MKESGSRSKKNWGDQKGLKKGKQLTELVVKGNARPVQYEARNTPGIIHPNAVSEYIFQGEVIVNPSITSKEPSAEGRKKPSIMDLNHWEVTHETGSDTPVNSHYNSNTNKPHQKQAISAYQDNTSTRDFNLENIFDEFA